MDRRTAWASRDAGPSERDTGAPMSQENVDIVRASWDAWGRGDMDALFEFYDPDVEWDMTHSYIPDMGVFRGHEGIRDFFRQWREFFAEYHAEPEQFIAADDSVMVRVRQTGRGRISTVGVEMPDYWQIYRLRDGRAVSVAIYRDEGEALKAVGLSS
jgi:ketosteroid isomerase-like protein